MLCHPQPRSFPDDLRALGFQRVSLIGGLSPKIDNTNATPQWFVLATATSEEKGCAPCGPLQLHKRRTFALLYHRILHAHNLADLTLKAWSRRIESRESVPREGCQHRQQTTGHRATLKKSEEVFLSVPLGERASKSEQDVRWVIQPLNL